MLARFGSAVQKVRYSKKVHKFSRNIVVQLQVNFRQPSSNPNQKLTLKPPNTGASPQNHPLRSLVGLKDVRNSGLW